MSSYFFVADCQGRWQWQRRVTPLEHHVTYASPPSPLTTAFRQRNDRIGKASELQYALLYSLILYHQFALPKPHTEKRRTGPFTPAAGPLCPAFRNNSSIESTTRIIAMDSPIRHIYYAVLDSVAMNERNGRPRSTGRGPERERTRFTASFLRRNVVRWRT